jgi:hypothetical protein
MGGLVGNSGRLQQGLQTKTGVEQKGVCNRAVQRKEGVEQIGVCNRVVQRREYSIQREVATW